MHRPLGKVTVTTGGTPVPATTAEKPIPLQYVMFQVLPGNTGVIYIRRKGTTDDRTDLVQTLAILPAPASATQGPFHSYTAGVPNGYVIANLQEYSIDAGVNGDGVLISGIG